MSECFGGTNDDLAGDIAKEFAILRFAGSCEPEVVSDIVQRAIRDRRPVERKQGDDYLLIHEAMLGVVRGALESRLDARETARGAILGVLQVVPPMGGSVLAAFRDAAGALILKTSALGGAFDATLEGILDAGLREEITLGLVRQDVESVVGAAAADAAVAFVQTVPLDVLWPNGCCCRRHTARP